MAPPIPALFVSHGPPTLPMEDLPARYFLEGLGAAMPRPTAVVSVSAHWETGSPMVTGTARQTTIHDFHGFPPELYQLRYEPAGDPALAARVVTLLQQAGLEGAIEPDRGLDHGAWTPLMSMLPDADVPVIQLSLQTGRGAAHHVALGQALAPLRDEGVLVLASGNLTHNLREVFRPSTDGATPDWVTEFQTWVEATLAAGDQDAIIDFQSAPQGQRNHPTPEHFLPLLVALGAGGIETARRLHASICYRVLAMDAYAFG